MNDINDSFILASMQKAWNDEESKIKTQKAEILIDDSVGRYKKGEIGEVLRNNYSEKYDYFIRLPGEMEIFFDGVKGPRDFYFYKHEIKLLPDKERMGKE